MANYYPTQLYAQYLKDPRYYMSQDAFKKATSGENVNTIGQGVAKLGQAVLGAYMARKVDEDYKGKSKEIADERKRAMAAMLKGDYSGVDALSPDNQDIYEMAMRGQMQERQNAALMDRQAALQEQMLKRQMDIEKFKQEQDPFNQILRQSLMAQGNANPSVAQPEITQPAPMNVTPDANIPPPSGIQISGNAPPQSPMQQPQQVPMQPAQGTQQLNQQDVLFNMALSAKGIKAPEGYIYNSRMELVPVPTGKAAMEQAQKGEAKQRLTESVQSMIDDYSKLAKGGGMVSTENPWYENVFARAASSEDSLWGVGPGGQDVGRAFGTENQTIRDRITSVRSLLLPQIMQATGMSAKQLDSNAELQMYLRSLAAPNMSKESAQTILQKVNDLFGIKGGVKLGGNSIKVISPEGKIGTIDQSELNQAISSGWRVAQ